jgi:hypothetical protein
VSTIISEHSEGGNGNGRFGRKQWWEHLPIPESWHLVDRDPSPYRERERGEPIDLDESRSGYRRRYDDSPPPAPRIQVPLSLVVTVVIYFIGQLIGSIWWAATLQSNLQHEIADRAKEESRLWQTVETYRLENNQLRVEVARNNTQIRNLKEGD